MLRWIHLNVPKQHIYQSIRSIAQNLCLQENTYAINSHENIIQSIMLTFSTYSCYFNALGIYSFFYPTITLQNEHVNRNHKFSETTLTSNQYNDFFPYVFPSLKTRIHIKGSNYMLESTRNDGWNVTKNYVHDQTHSKNSIHHCKPPLSKLRYGWYTHHYCNKPHHTIQYFILQDVHYFS